MAKKPVDVANHKLPNNYLQQILGYKANPVTPAQQAWIDGMRNGTLFKSKDPYAKYAPVNTTREQRTKQYAELYGDYYDPTKAEVTTKTGIKRHKELDAYLDAGYVVTNKYQEKWTVDNPVVNNDWYYDVEFDQSAATAKARFEAAEKFKKEQVEKELAEKGGVAKAQQKRQEARGTGVSAQMFATDQKSLLGAAFALTDDEKEMAKLGADKSAPKRNPYMGKKTLL